MEGHEHFMLFNRSHLAEADIHSILSSPRRRETLRHLVTTADAISVRELADHIAAAEADCRPAPKNVRDAVYVSLHQTHLPALHDLGIVNYDREARCVEPHQRVHEVGKYMDIDSPLGLSWAELYRSLGLVGLCLVVAAHAAVPGIESVPPILWASGALAALAAASAWHLWTYRWGVLRALLP